MSENVKLNKRLDNRVPGYTSWHNLIMKHQSKEQLQRITTRHPIFCKVQSGTNININNNHYC